MSVRATPQVKAFYFSSKRFFATGKVATGRARYLLNIMYFTYRCSNHLFSVFGFQGFIFFILHNDTSLNIYSKIIDTTIIYNYIY